MTQAEEFDLQYAAEQLRRSRHPLRKLIKKFYLDRVLREVSGPTIDFGCGAGQLLSRLPAGSVGLELNKNLVCVLQASGLNACFYDAFADDFTLSTVPPGQYRSLVISHVLEHFDDAERVIRRLWAACEWLGVEVIIAIVPGARGYASDATHKTFVTEAWLQENNLRDCAGFHLAKCEYFPLNRRQVGDYLVFHELKLVYRRKAKGSR